MRSDCILNCTSSDYSLTVLALHDVSVGMADHKHTLLVNEKLQDAIRCAYLTLAY